MGDFGREIRQAREHLSEVGHKNISITGDLYSHVIPAMHEDATSRVAALAFGSQPSKHTTMFLRSLSAPSPAFSRLGHLFGTFGG